MTLRAILEYDLTDPDAARAHALAVKAQVLAVAVWELDQRLRSVAKYAETRTVDAMDVCDWLRVELGPELTALIFDI